jgi:hypothetical protein
VRLLSSTNPVLTGSVTANGGSPGTGQNVGSWECWNSGGLGGIGVANGGYGGYYSGSGGTIGPCNVNPQSGDPGYVLETILPDPESLFAR